MRPEKSYTSVGFAQAISSTIATSGSNTEQSDSDAVAVANLLIPTPVACTEHMENSQNSEFIEGSASFEIGYQISFVFLCRRAHKAAN